jgi:hypothetical protein
MRACWSLAIVVSSLPFIQGAGCTAHYSAQVHGRVVADGGPVIVIYRTHVPGAPSCEPNWEACLRQEGWQPLIDCKAERFTPMKFEGATFDGCTRMIGVNYVADIAAFVDKNGDGRLGPGEPYGVYPGNPMTREKERGAMPLKIPIDRVMP